MDRIGIMKGLLAVVLAGGAGKRLFPLTRDRAKPAVPFGGGYRIIDFTLSNCFNSGIRKILLLTQYKTMSLDRHIAMGWTPFFCRPGGEFIDVLPPQQRIGADWYQGTANAVYQNIYALERESPTDILILAGDHIYRMDYGRLFERHRRTDADLTIGSISVPIAEARGRLGVLQIDEDGRVIGFEEKPERPRPDPRAPDRAIASMGIYVFKAGFLFETLCRDATRVGSRHDFGSNIIPRLLESDRVYACPFAADGDDALYWRDVGTIDSYYEANMDLISVEPSLNLYDRQWPIYTCRAYDPPAKFVFAEERRRGEALNSIVSPGTIVSGGSVRHSVLGPRVLIESCAEVEDSILFRNARIGRHARVRRAILDKGAVVADGERIGFDPEEDRRRGCMVTETQITVVPGPGR